MRRAFEQAPESHRAEGFVQDFRAAQQLLCELVRAQNVELFLGSGTLANDVVAMSTYQAAKAQLDRAMGINTPVRGGS